MIPLDRRSLFAAATAAAGWAAVPAWVARALVLQDGVSAWRVEQLRAALARAKEKGRPVLVLVAPSTFDGDFRGMWFGVWMDPPARQPLWTILAMASCELACATVDEVAGIAGRKITGTPLWVLLDASRFGEDPAQPLKTTEVPCELPAMAVAEGTEPSDLKALLQRAALEGVGKMGDALRDGMTRHGLDPVKLAANEVRRLDEEQKSALDAWFNGGAWPGNDLVLLAASEFIRRSAALPEAAQRTNINALCSAIHEGIVKRPVAGARWWSGERCGGGFEHETAAEKRSGRIACGMGLVAGLCDRFLSFWSKGV